MSVIRIPVNRTSPSVINEENKLNSALHQDRPHTLTRGDAAVGGDMHKNTSGTAAPWAGSCPQIDQTGRLCSPLGRRLSISDLGGGEWVPGILSAGWIVRRLSDRVYALLSDLDPAALVAMLKQQFQVDVAQNGLPGWARSIA